MAPRKQQKKEEASGLGLAGPVGEQEPGAEQSSHTQFLGGSIGERRRRKRFKAP